MFKNFEDYDLYAFYSANRLFFALRRNQINQGKVIKGKLIRPIKSCLNYMKALLYPMKIEYQREAFQEVLSEEFATKTFDAMSLKENLRTAANSANGVSELFGQYLQSTIVNSNRIITNILDKSPFSKNTLEYRRLKISVLLNCINILKLRHKLDCLPQTIVL